MKPKSHKLGGVAVTVMFVTACGSCSDDLRDADGWTLGDRPPESREAGSDVTGIGPVFDVIAPDEIANIPRKRTEFGGKTGHGPTGEIDLAHADVVLADPWNWLESVQFAGDVNDDGYDDLLIGNPQCCLDLPQYAEPGNRGATFLIYGGPRSDIARRQLLGEEYAMFLGERFEDNLGTNFAAPGDVNGDGVDDFVMSAVPGSTYGENQDRSDKTTSRVYVFFGDRKRYEGPTNASRADVIIEQRHPDFGSPLAGGDFDADGHGDLMVGSTAWSYPDPARRVSVLSFYGPLESRDEILPAAARDSQMTADTTRHSLSSFATVANVEGERDALLLGSSVVGNSEGSGYAVLRDRDEARLDSAMDVTMNASVFRSERSRSPGEVAQTVADGGDLNGDGVKDALVAAPDETSGTVFAVPATLRNAGEYDLHDTGTQIGGNGEPTVFPQTVAGGGDVNGDGYSDILVSARLQSSDSDPGAVYLLYGRPDLFAQSTSIDEAAATFRGVDRDVAGLDLALDGDFDGDGYDDIVITTFRRRVYVVYGGP